MIENRAVNRVQATGSGNHCAQDESNDMNELEFGTWKIFRGEGTNDVRYSKISEVDEVSSRRPCSSGSGELQCVALD